MSKIKLLDKALIDKIAAGEVVERPASVVKELLENGIDAGSTRLEIEIRGGGIDYIRVSDNGIGMNEEDLVLAFARHATSKLDSEADLWALGSMGFRGEALSSIAAVSQVEMYSNPGEEGHCIKVDGGMVISSSAAPAPPGTSVTVTNLFYNTPVRRKFLKSTVAEGNQVYDTVVRLALSHPEISFSFRNEHRQVFMTSGNGELREVALAIFGKDYSHRLLDIELQYGDIMVTGLISKPELTRKNRRGQIFMVNRRVVKNSVLSLSLEEAYRGLLLQRERPVGIVFLTMPPDQVDVNVHPQKSEVRFSDEKAVFMAIKTAVREKLFQATNPDLTGESYRTRVESNHQHQPLPSYISEPVNIRPQPVMREDPLEFAAVLEDNTPSVNLYGQWQDSYLICEIDGMLNIIDQHAAHERLLFNQLKAQPVKRASQELAVPVAVELPPDLLLLAESRQGFLENLGYVLDRIGEKTMVIRSIPALAAGGEVETLMEILDTWQSQPLTAEMELDNGLKVLACKGAVKAGQRLESREMMHLIREWVNTENRSFCPHGRPTCYTVDKAEMDRLMKR
ncbi:MAG: DNA mismatch repair endonuclease MutL [Syntrophomonadales bacterium]